MAFSTLIGAPLVQIEKKPTAKQITKLQERGCPFCPRNKKKGINKVFGKVKGREVIIWGMAPGRDENEAEKEFVGASGQLLWAELKKVGIRRKDVDVQNVVRCFPADKEDSGYLRMRDPNKEELHCCSVYTDKAVKKSKAKIYVVLGAVAQKQLLGKEYKSSKKIFWSERLQAKVYCLYHPSYFVRGQYPPIVLDEWRENLKAIASDLGKKSLSQYAYIEDQKYRAITTVEGAWKLRKKLQVAKGRVAADIEYGKDTHGYIGKKNKTILSCCGFSTKPGEADVLIIDHPKARKVDGKWRPLNKTVRKRIAKIFRLICSDTKIRKTFHEGSTDIPFIEGYYPGQHVKGYDYDTIYAEFLKHPDARAYGLYAIGLRRFPQFGDYKTIILPEVIKQDVDLSEVQGLKKDADIDQIYKFVSKNNMMNYAQLPLKKLVLRNGADCDLTKRIELSTKKDVNPELLKIYMGAAFVLRKMEPNGPELDFVQLKKLKKVYPVRRDDVKNKINLIAGRDDFNTNSPDQVRELLYTKLKIKAPREAYGKSRGLKFDEDNEMFVRRSKKTGKWEKAKPGTGKGVLELLAGKHEIARLITEYRMLAKLCSTYLDGYEICAKNNHGKLRTKWWLTGTRTGRLSSGGGAAKLEDQQKQDLVNLQNIHGNSDVQNLITADPEWKKLYVAVHKAVKKSGADISGKLRSLVEKSLQVKKEKKTVYEEKINALIDGARTKLYKSLRFSKLCKKLLKAYGHVNILLGFDQGQVEVRMMAQISGDKNLINDCKKGDIHSQVGHRMTGWAIEKIKKDKKTRTLTKNVHFGILFGLGADGLVRFIKAKDPSSDITVEKAEELLRNYFTSYPRVAKFIEKCRAFVEKHGYIDNIFGFKRQLKKGEAFADFDDEDANDAVEEGGAFWGNQAINTPVQGAAHMLMLMALCVLRLKKKLYKELQTPTLEIHDYLGWKVQLKDALQALVKGKTLLEIEPVKYIKKHYPEVDWQMDLEVEGKGGFRLGDSVEFKQGIKLHEMLAEMFLSTLRSETKLNAAVAQVS